MNIPAPEYGYLQELLSRTSANTLDDDKHYLVNARLTPIAHQHGHADVAGLLRAIRTTHPHLRDEVVEAMTINETSFFRDLHPFRTLSEHIVPELNAAHRRPLRMWSAAAATGQEAYSLALLMADEFPTAPAPDILGTDISAAALERARTGVYTQLEVNRGLPARLLVRYFTQEGRNWQVKPELRRSVRFERMNLSQARPVRPLMDVIFLRNVLIYFSEPTRHAVLRTVVDSLAPGGYLLLGNAENLMVRSERVERVELGRSICFRARE